MRAFWEVFPEEGRSRGDNLRKRATVVSWRWEEGAIRGLDLGAALCPGVEHLPTSGAGAPPVPAPSRDQVPSSEAWLFISQDSSFQEKPASPVSFPELLFRRSVVSDSSQSHGL